MQVNKHTLDRFNIWIFRGDGRSLDCNLTNKAPLGEPLQTLKNLLNLKPLNFQIQIQIYF